MARNDTEVRQFRRVGDVLVGGRSGGVANQRVPANTVRFEPIPTTRELLDARRRGDFTPTEGGVFDRNQRINPNNL